MPAKKRKAAFSPSGAPATLVDLNGGRLGEGNVATARAVRNVVSPRQGLGGSRARGEGSGPVRGGRVDESVLVSCVRAIVWACVAGNGEGNGLGAHCEEVVSVRSALAAARETLVPQNLKVAEKCARSELLAALETRPILTWAPCGRPESFLDFQGCEVCLRLCQAERVLLAGGDLYDSRVYWPEPCEYEIDSHTSLDSGSTRLMVRLTDPRTGPPVLPPVTMDGAPVAFNRSKNTTKEFWTDKSCSLRCLLYHELAHFVARVSEAARRMVVDELEKGEILVAKETRGTLGANRDNGAARGNMPLDRLQRHLAGVVLGNESFISSTLQWLQTACNIRKHVKSKNRRVQVPDDLFDSELELDLDEVAGAHVKLMYQRTQQAVGV